VFGFEFRGRFKESDVRCGEQTTPSAVCTTTKPPIRIFLYYAHDKLALDKGTLVVLCCLSNNITIVEGQVQMGKDTSLVIILSNGSEALVARCGSGGDCLRLWLGFCFVHAQLRQL
jgi:hypothetical protein